MTQTSDLIQAAIADLQATTITYQQWRKNVLAGKYPDPNLTKWGAAFDKLDKAIQLEQQPTTPPPATWTIAPPTGQITTITNVPGLGVNATTRQDLADIVIDTTGDSGALFQLNAAGSSLRRVQMRNIAALNKVTYGKHAIYGKAANLTLEDIDAQCSAYCASCFSLRYDGATLRRFNAAGAPHAVTYYETSSVAGNVLVEHGTGTFTDDTAIWMDAETSYQQVIRQAFALNDLHFTGPGAYFLKAYQGRFQGFLTINGCTLNGQPVTAQMIAGIDPTRLTIT